MQKFDTEKFNASFLPTLFERKLKEAQTEYAELMIQLLSLEVVDIAELIIREHGKNSDFECV